MYILSKCKREQQHGAKIGSLLKKQLESSHCQPVSFWTLQRLSQMNNSTSLDSETEKTSSLVKFKKHLKSKQLNLSSGSTSYQFSNHMYLVFFSIPSKGNPGLSRYFLQRKTLWITSDNKHKIIG